MRIGVFGDVMGRSGRQGLADHLPELKRRLALEFVVVNGENAAGGFGINEKTANEIFAAGADVITLGNHAFDQTDAPSFLDREPRLIRPTNYPLESMIAGRGAGLYEAANGGKVLVLNPMGRVFMDPLDDPFVAVERELSQAPLGEVADAVIVDMHAESTSEKYGMGHFCDGRASVVVGTHTHIPTADAHVLPKGTAFQCDLGMCGDYDSIIGMDKEEPMRRFTTRMRGGKYTAASGPASVCGLYIETDDKTGLATRCESIRVGGLLPEQVPAAVAHEAAE